MTKQPSKTRKLRWLNRARIAFAMGVSDFTCNAVKFAQYPNYRKPLHDDSPNLDALAAQDWYARATASFIDNGRAKVDIDDFHNSFTQYPLRREYRAMWLAMLETLVNAEEI